MGQKINPNLFRLVINNNFLSNWYAEKLKYLTYLKEDNYLRIQIYKILNIFLVVSNIEINRIFNKLNFNHYINIKINILYPRIKDIYSKIIKYLIIILNKKNKFLIDILSDNDEDLKIIFILILQNQIKKLIVKLQNKIKKNIFFDFVFIKNFFEDSNLINQIIIDQIKKRIPFKRIMNQIILKSKSINNLKGLKIEMSGRLDGIEIARSEWKQYKSLPLQTLNANIKYSSLYVKTIYGIIGVKTWLFLN